MACARECAKNSQCETYDVCPGAPVPFKYTCILKGLDMIPSCDVLVYSASSGCRHGYRMVMNGIEVRKSEIKNYFTVKFHSFIANRSVH